MDVCCGLRDNGGALLAGPRWHSKAPGGATLKAFHGESTRRRHDGRAASTRLARSSRELQDTLTTTIIFAVPSPSPCRRQDGSPTHSI